MKHFVITLGCEYGSGGPDIGRMIAESLGIEFYDRALIDKVVEELGVDSGLVEKADTGDQIRYEFDTTLGPRYANLTNRVIHTQFDVIRKLADNSSCLIVGRCSDYVLRDREDCLNVFVYAPEDYRVKHIMEHKGLSEKEAREQVRYYDATVIPTLPSFSSYRRFPAPEGQRHPAAPPLPSPKPAPARGRRAPVA